MHAATASVRGEAKGALATAIARWLVGLVAVSPGGGLVSEPWVLFARAAGKPDPMPLDYVVAFSQAVRTDPVLWPVLSLLVTGGVAGALARCVVPGSRVGGSAGTLLLGVFAAAAGGWICHHLGAPLPTELSVLNIGVAFTIAVILLVMGRIARL